MRSQSHSNIIGLGAFAVASAILLAACNHDDDPAGPKDQGAVATQTVGDATAGKDIFRFETFGNERFWTDAVKLPAGIAAAQVTPMQALALGLVVDVDQLPADVKTAVATQLAADPTGATSPLLNDPATTIALINLNAIVGFAAKDTNGDGVIDIAHGDKVGATCALCHAVTDGSVLKVANGGSIGKRLDGLANHFLDFGTIVSVGQNSRAIYPLLQLQLAANGNSTLGRASAGLTENSSEADVDAYLTDKNAYPVGMFDDSFDGNGDPMHNTPLFEMDLAAPYGSEGTFDKQSDFANTVYTALLDPTNLTTPGGRAFLLKLGGAAGTEIADDYVHVLADTGVTGYPYAETTAAPAAADVGTLAYPLGVRVDEQKLSNLTAFLFSLTSPAGVNPDPAATKRGEKVFRAEGCTSCHNSDQTVRVPSTIIPMKTIFPGDAPVTLATRDPPLNPVLNTPGSIFDDKMAVVNASIRNGLPRGTALPLLLDLARKPVFLHDNSVASLEALLDPTRGANAPHPFYVTKQTSDLIAYLKAQQSTAP